MDFNISKLAYYTDFIVFPLLMVVALYAGLSWSALALVPAGWFAWTFVEYAAHRWLFHAPKYFRREHFAHHVRPERYIGVHPGYTCTGAVALLGALWGSFGVAAGGALFCSIALGYMTYIAVHDGMHHGSPVMVFRHVARMEALHAVHHKATSPDMEANFGVSTAFWDGILGTYKGPLDGSENPPRRVLTL